MLYTVLVMFMFVVIHVCIYAFIGSEESNLRRFYRLIKSQTYVYKNHLLNFFKKIVALYHHNCVK